MKSTPKFWAVVLCITFVLALGVYVWDQRNREAIETSGANAGAVIEIAPQVTNGVVVAIGSFDFAEPDNRFPEFRDGLGRYLDGKADPKVTFVDRRPGGKSAPTSPDAWILNGSYQALPGAKWGATLKLERVRGGVISFTAEGEKGDDLNEKIAAGVIKAVTIPSTNLQTLMGKREEVTLHLERGIYLAQLADPTTFGIRNPHAVYFQNRDDAERRKFRLREAMRSFESAMVLAPENKQAKTRLAESYLSSFIGDTNKARALLAEVIESGPRDKSQDIARFQLAQSWEMDDPKKALELYRELSTTMTNGIEGALVKSRVESMARVLKLPQDDTFEPKKRRLMADLDDFVARLERTNRVSLHLNITHPYESITNATERAARSLAFIEELKPKYARLTPHVLLSYLQGQGDTEPSVHAAFGKMINELKTNLSAVAAPKMFFNHTWDHQTISLFDSNEELAMEALVLKEAAAAAGLCEALSDRMHVAKGVFLMNRAKLAEAIEAFEKAGGRTVAMNAPGPWGCGTCPCGACPVSTLALAERCQKLLDGTSKRPGFHIELEKAIFTSKHERPLLASDGESIWVGDSKRFLQFGPGGEKIAEHRFAAPAYVSALACAGNKLYVGTMGGGLLEVDKANFQTKTWRVDDGLLSDHVCELKVAGNQLWIGYGHRTEINPFAVEPEGRPEFGRASRGGVGFLDLASGSVTNFLRPKEVPPDNPSVWMNKNNYGDWAPSQPTLAVERGPDSAIYLAVYLRGMQRLEPATGKWSAVRFEAHNPISSIAVSEEFICAGQRAGGYITVPARGIWIRPRGAADFKFFSSKDGLPNDDVGALMIEGKTLWAGGFGYVAELRLDEMKVARVITVPAREVTRLIKVGGNLWISTEDRIFHVKTGS